MCSHLAVKSGLSTSAKQYMDHRLSRLAIAESCDSGSLGGKCAR